jgi:outer membrane receptor protein involved in Fe transport
VQTTWRPRADWRLNAAARAMSAQFDDDENTLRLAPAVTLDLAIAWTVAPGREVTVAVENLYDERVETSRTREGLVGLAPPRVARAGISVNW